MKPRVLLTARVPGTVLTRLEAACDVDLHDASGGLAAADLLGRVVGARGLMCVVTDRVDARVIDAGRDLRVIANIAVGYDNIDVRAASDRGIVVTNTPDVLTAAVAELTWGLILSITRRIAEGDRLIRHQAWRGWTLDFMLGTELSGKQLGVVGAGRIGRAVAARAEAFGMRAVFARRRADPGSGPERSDAGSLPLDQLLVTSDVVTIHVPLTESTRHLIDRRALARMKRSAYLINTSRGPVVDEAALAWALRERLLAGAALDVYEEEPRVHPGLLDLPNVVLAPHLGSGTRETRTAMAELAARNVLAVLSGGDAITPVTPR